MTMTNLRKSQTYHLRT